jgi:hypothetical protein
MRLSREWLTNLVSTLKPNLQQFWISKKGNLGSIRVPRTHTIVEPNSSLLLRSQVTSSHDAADGALKQVQHYREALYRFSAHFTSRYER